MGETSQSASFMRSLGPGLLFAGAAVGVSHLVQSTRAGADYGFALVGVILLANVLKYPAFSFGPRYAAATGTSLLEGYRRQGRWALVLYGLLTIGTMFTVQAAVTVVTAALLKFAFGLDLWLGSAILTGVCVGLLALGRYPWLERVMKWVMAVLTISTLAAAVMAAGSVDWVEVDWSLPDGVLSDTAKVMFIAALIGWMPSAIDISVWHSLWTLAKGRKEGGLRPVRETMRDFNIGYLGTVLLAVSFVVLGAGVMHGGESLSDNAGVFAGQVIGMFTGALGPMWEPVILTACVTVMFSTMLTVVDGFPRAIGTLVARFQGAEVPLPSGNVGAFPSSESVSRPVYYTAMALLGAGSLTLLGMMLSSLKDFVDVATTLSFCTAAPLSWLNHRAVFGKDVPMEARPSAMMRVWSWIGILFAASFTAYYLWIRFGG